MIDEADLPPFLRTSEHAVIYHVPCIFPCPDGASCTYCGTCPRMVPDARAPLTRELAQVHLRQSGLYL